jgi:predicted esterase YcpF (UPF0227 family)
LILYLHGFRSSPQSYKARLMKQALQERGLENRWLCPQLPPSPKQALAAANDLILQAQQGRAIDHVEDDLVVIGSSLGGYYAGCLAQRWGCRAVLLNPVIYAARDLATQVGEQSNYHGAGTFTFGREYVDELADMAVGRPTDPRRYFLLAATGDEVLDWREMADWYKGSRQHIIQGGDHGISDFEAYLPMVLEFASIPG